MNMTSKYKRIVVKIGTSSIINSDNSINMKTIHTLSSVLSQLNQSDHEVILVTSGAVGVGMNTIELKTRPTDIGKLQALSAIGQSELMDLYSDSFKESDQTVAQLLLTHATWLTILRAVKMYLKPLTPFWKIRSSPSSTKTMPSRSTNSITKPASVKTIN